MESGEVGLIDFISPREVVVEPGEVEIFQLEINSEGVPPETCHCWINVESDKGDDYWTDIFIYIG